MELKYKKTPRKSTDAQGKAAKAVKIISLLLSLLLIAGAVTVYILRGGAQPQPVLPDAPDTPVADPLPEPDPEPDLGGFVSQAVLDAYNENNDVVGWLTVDGCEIDNRVFQAADNDYYLRRDEQGEYDVWGCYFLDYINIHDGHSMEDRVNIIYGHSLDDYAESEKFSKLKRYRDAAFAAEHPYIRFDLLYCEQKWQIFACTNIPITIDYIDPNPNDSKLQTTLDYMLQNSFVDFDVDVDLHDQLLLLSTCTSDDNVRFVVAAKLVATGEEALN
ncbi:MAG: class B sortase [Oscillospiraceae bacterium]|nr:class B sortase [Oscillospiraceae bacterium]